MKMASESIVTLNVGGQIFQTTMHTLTKYPDSMLATMFRHSKSGLSPLPKTQEGHYFLDADPDFFKVILNWLRLSKITTNDSNLHIGVIELADYLGLDQLKIAIEERKKTIVIQERKKQHGKNAQNIQKSRENEQLQQLVNNTGIIKIYQEEAARRATKKNNHRPRSSYGGGNVHDNSHDTEWPEQW